MNKNGKAFTVKTSLKRNGLDVAAMWKFGAHSRRWRGEKGITTSSTI